METLKVSKHLAGLVVTAAILCLFAALPVAAQGDQCICGPGSHWVDQCGAGEDEIANTRATVGIEIPPGGTVFSFILGPCPNPPDNLLRISRSNPLDDSQNFPGSRPLDGHLDVIDTEIIKMCLKKDNIILRAGAGNQQGPVVLGPSLGVIAELPGNDSLAESWYDVFFEVDYNGTFMYNQVPVRVVDTIICVPPQAARYIHISGVTPLFDAQGVHVANLVSAQHWVNPDDDIPTLTEWGMIIFCALLLGWMAWVIVRRRRTAAIRM